MTLDAGNVVLSANAEAARVWGGRGGGFHRSSGQRAGAARARTHPEDWRAMFLPDRRTQTVGSRGGGETFPLELRLTETLLHGGATDPAGGKFYTLCARDISDRVEAEHMVAAARDAALESARARSEFVANVSHELRTPMNGVLGATDLLDATDLNAEQRELVDTIRTSGDSLLTIINDILDFSKMEAGKMALEVIEFDLRQLVESTADVLAGRALQKQLELIAYIEPGTPTQLLGDPARVRQIILNLLSNAIKFTKSGEVLLRVRCEGTDEACATLRFSVQDTGVGIDPAARERLFHAFSQAEVSTARNFGGTGLGPDDLAATRGIDGRSDRRGQRAGGGFDFLVHGEVPPPPVGRRPGGKRKPFAGRIARGAGVGRG